MDAPEQTVENRQRQRRRAPQLHPSRGPGRRRRQSRDSIQASQLERVRQPPSRRRLRSRAPARPPLRHEARAGSPCTRRPARPSSAAVRPCTTADARRPQRPAAQPDLESDPEQMPERPRLDRSGAAGPQPAGLQQLTRRASPPRHRSPAARHQYADRRLKCGSPRARRASRRNVTATRHPHTRRHNGSPEISDSVSLYPMNQVHTLQEHSVTARADLPINERYTTITIGRSTPSQSNKRPNIENAVVDQILTRRLSRREFVRHDTIIDISLPTLTLILGACR